MGEFVSKPRGRPRQYDKQAAKRAILDVFWEKGYTSTSLDDLSKVTGMVRPSLYGAFGSKADMYLMSMDVFLERLSDVRVGLDSAKTPESAIREFLLRMIEAYFGDDPDKQLGCFLIGTAISEAPTHPEIREALTERLGRFNGMLVSAFTAMRPDTPSEKIEFAAQQGAATMHSIAVRARAGEGREKLTEFAGKSAEFIATILEN